MAGGARAVAANCPRVGAYGAVQWTRRGFPDQYTRVPQREGVRVEGTSHAVAGSEQTLPRESDRYELRSLPRRSGSEAGVGAVPGSSGVEALPQVRYREEES